MSAIFLFASETFSSSGPYRYISLKNFLIQQEINFKDYVITFEVTDAHEQWEGKPVYRLIMRQTSKSAVIKQETVQKNSNESKD